MADDFGPTRAAWSPDGKFLLVAQSPRGIRSRIFDTEVYEFSVADVALRALTNRKGPDGLGRFFQRQIHRLYWIDDRYQATKPPSSTS